MGHIVDLGMYRIRTRGVALGAERASWLRTYNKIQRQRALERSFGMIMLGSATTDAYFAGKMAQG